MSHPCDKEKRYDYAEECLVPPVGLEQEGHNSQVCPYRQKDEADFAYNGFDFHISER